MNNLKEFCNILLGEYLNRNDYNLFNVETKDQTNNIESYYI